MKEPLDHCKPKDALPSLETILNGEVDARWSSPILPRDIPVSVSHPSKYEFSPFKVSSGEYAFESSLKSSAPFDNLQSGNNSFHK